MMKALIKKVFTPPDFGEEEDGQPAYLLHVILWGLIVIPIPYVLFAIIFTPLNAPQALLQGGISEVINIFLLVWLHRGYVRAASLAQISAFWLFLIIPAFTGTGIQGEAYLLGYPLVIVIAGILLGGRMALGVTIASLLAGLVMVFTENYGGINASLDRPLFFTWIVSRRMAWACPP